MSTAKLDQLKIDREEEKKRSRVGLYSGVTLFVLVLAAGAYWYAPGASSTIYVQLASAREVSAESTATVLNASGYVTARRQATVSSEMTGKVTEVLIEEGMKVEKGQVLARLDGANLAASYQLAAAQRDAAETSLQETEALLKEAQASLERVSNLVDRGLASAAELDSARAKAEALAAQAARRRADIEVAEKNLLVWSERLEDTVIRAPFAGVVVAKNAQPGEMISPISAGGGFTRTGIGTVVDMESLEIEIDVNEAYINRVTAGQRVLATLDAYPDWQIPCYVIAIIPTADRQRATVEVRVGFDNLDPRVLPDMGVKVAFQESRDQVQAARRIGIPAAAVSRDNGRDIVFVVQDGRAERRAVSIVEYGELEVILASGITVGERVVIDQSEPLSDGAAVREQAQR